MQGKTGSTTLFDLDTALPQQHVNLEVDLARQRDYGRWLAVGLALLAALLFNGWQRQQTFDHGFRQEEIRTKTAAAEALGRHLYVEVESLRTPGRIDELARQQGLVPPTRDDVVFVERLNAPPQPHSSVVARR
jgi:hypothetical protein